MNSVQETLGQVQSTAVSVTTLLGVILGMFALYVAYKLTTRLFNAVSFVSKATYASPFLAFIVGLGMMGFSLGDMADNNNPNESKQSLAAFTIQKGANNGTTALIEAMKITKEAEEKSPGSMSRVPVTVGVDSTDAKTCNHSTQRLLTPALDSMLLCLGVGLAVSGFVMFGINCNRRLYD